ncbi:hypothetical protein GGI22_006591, partial [Coemansia erecta]
MSSYGSQHPVVGAASTSSVAADAGDRDGSLERELENGLSFHGDTRRGSFDNARRGLGTRSIYIAPIPAPESTDNASANYSQTPDSIRDRTMLLSNMRLRNSISSNRAETVAVGLDGSRRSSMDDRTSISQIIAETGGDGGGNLSRLPRDRSPPLRSLYVPIHGSDLAGADAALPQFDGSYIRSQRVPRNAKHPELHAEQQLRLPDDYGTVKQAPDRAGEHHMLHAAARKQSYADAHAPREEDRLLLMQPPPCSIQDADGP